MKIITRYIIGDVFKYLFLVLALIISLVVAIDYLGTMDEFLHAKISLVRAFYMVILRIPFISSQLIWIAFLLSVLIVFGLMNKNNEIVTIKASGISVFALLRPVLFVGILLGIVLIFLSETIIPITILKANLIHQKEIRKQTDISSKGENIWIKGNRQMTHIKYYHPSTKRVFGVTRYFFDEDFRLIKRIDAPKGIFQNKDWVLHDLMEQILDTKTGEVRVLFHDTHHAQMDIVPEDLKKVVKKSEEMSFRELLSYIRKVRAEGYDATIYQVDLYAKTALPFLCIIMCLMGTGLAAGQRIGAGLPRSISFGIVIGFLYWVFFTFCLSLGYGELLPPFVAAWMANFVFLSFGILSLMNAE